MFCAIMNKRVNMKHNLFTDILMWAGQIGDAAEV
jgi:hypothetical protein